MAAASDQQIATRLMDPQFAHEKQLVDAVVKAAPHSSDAAAFRALQKHGGNLQKAIQSLARSQQGRSASAPAAFGSPTYYEWRDDHGWKRYDDHASWIIAKANGAKVQVNRGTGMNYDIDLAALTQTNRSTQKVRPIRQTTDVIRASLLSGPQPPLHAGGGGGLFGGSTIPATSRGGGGLFGAAPVFVATVGGYPFGAPPSRRRGGGGGLFGGGRPEPEPSSDSLFGTESQQIMPGEEHQLDFSDVVQQECQITRWWDVSLPPVACTDTVFRYSVATIVRDSAEWEGVQAMLNQSMKVYGDGPQLKALFRVQNKRLLKEWRAYHETLKEDMATDGSTTGTEYRIVYHGCSRPENINSIAHSGFDVVYSSSESSINAFGSGVYFGSSPQVSETYCCPAPREMREAGAPQGSNVVFLSLLIKGDMCVGERKQCKPRFIRGSKVGRRFDTFCDKMNNPSIYVATHNSQAYPAYMLCL